MVEMTCPVTGTTLHVAEANVVQFETFGYKRKEQPTEQPKAQPKKQPASKARKTN